MDNPSDPRSVPASTSAVVDRYQQHCQSGPMPDLAGFVASVPKIDPRELAALVHVDQRHRYAAGVPLPAESYFESFPALRSDTELALDVVYQEYVLRRDAGEVYSTDKYLARFPDLAKQLAMQFDLDGAMGDEHSSRSMATGGATVELSPAYPPGTVIAGRYKLLEEIGEGGMGTVWVAQQTEPVRRRVALKLIKPGMDSRQVLSRFEAERQALAVMDHPHIAKVLDGGMTDQGRPYFVMEYVKGEPITDYCDHARLSVQERLKLFVQVCQAVQHAHQKGIIHRDLKPSNILVCPYDGQPVPKVIDFGLAKAMHQPLTEHSLYTAHGVMVGTPLYMSPEQAETNNLDIDTRSDLYSLGVILYELLTGSTPLEKRRLQDAALQEMLRLIQEEEPPKPSTRLSGSGSLPTIAAQRSLEPAQLSRAVRGDLDWIVMKALEKERSRRYETANGLARDIERYLHDDPVEARPPSAGYRFSKFARRNKAALLTVGLVAAVLVTGTIVSTWQAIRASRAERVAQAKQAEADANFQKAKAAVDKYFTLVSESKLFQVPGLEPLRKDLLEAALEFYEGAALERSDDPAVLADMAVTQMRVSQIYLTLTRFDDAELALRKALDSVDRLLREHPNASEAHLRLAGSWKGRQAVKSATVSDPKGALQTLLRMERIWAELARRYPAEPAFQSDLAGYVGVIGEAWEVAGRWRDSVVAHRKARAILQKLIRDYPTVAQYRADMMTEITLLAVMLRMKGEKGEEEVALRREAADLSEALVAEFPSVPAYRFARAECLTWLGHQFSKDQPQAAEQSFRRASELAESLIEEFPNQRKYAQLWERAVGASPVFDRPMDDYSQVEEAVNKVIERFEARLKARPNPLVRAQFAFYCENRAREFPRQGDFIALAERLHQRARALNTELDNEFPGDWDTVVQRAEFHGSAAGDLWGAGRMDEAAERFMASVAVMEKAGRQRPEWLYDVSLLADRTIDLARIMAYGARTTDDAAACRLCRRASQMLDEKLKQDPARRAFLAVAVRAYCERLLKGPERLPEAEQMMTWSAPIVEQTIKDVALLDALTADPAAPQYKRHMAAETQKWLAKILTWTDRTAQAEEMWQRAIRSYEAIANDHRDQQMHVQNVLQDYRQHLGARVEQLVKDGRPDEAETLHRNATDAFEKMAAEHPKSAELYRAFQADILLQLTAILVAGGHVEDAVAAARGSVDACQTLTKEYPGNLQYRQKLAYALEFLAEQLRKTGRQQEVSEVYRQAIAGLENLADDAQVRIYRGTLLRDSGEFDQAIADCDWVIAKDPKLAEAWDLRGSCYLRKGELAKVVKDYSEAIKLKPREGWYWHERAYAYLILGQHEKAIADHTAAIEISDLDAGQRLRRGQSYQALGELEKAEEDYSRAIELNPVYWENWYARGQLYAQQDQWDKAAVEYTKAIELNPAAWRQIVDSLKASGSHAESEKVFRLLITLYEKLAADLPADPQYRETLGHTTLQLGDLLTTDGQREEAVKAFRESRTIFDRLAADFPDNLAYRLRIASALGLLVERLSATGQNDEAEAARQRVVQIWEALLAENPQDRQAREQLAIAVGDVAISLQSQSDRERCEPFLRRALARRVELAKEIPGDPVHLEQVGHFTRRLGWLARDKGQSDEARQCFADAADTFEKLAADRIPQRDGFYRAYQIDSLWDLARLLAASDAKQAAAVAERSVDACQTLTKEYPGNLQYQQRLASALGFLAERLVATGQNDEAEAARQRIIKIWEPLLAEQPQDRQAREQLASALLAAADGLQGQRDRSVRDGLLRRALALRVELEDATVVSNNAIVDARLQRAQLHNRLGEWNEAIDQLEKAGALSKENDNPQRDKIAAAYLELCFAAWNQSKLDVIEAAARKAIEFHPNYSAAHLWLGIALTNLGKQEEAIAALRKAVELKPDDSGNYRSLSLALWRHGKLDEAINAIRKAIELQPEHGDLYIRLGSILIQQGKMEEGVVAFDKAITLNPADANTLNQLAWFLATAPESQHRDPSRAVELAKKGVELAPNDGAIWNTLGVAQYRAGEWQAAIDDLQKAMDLRNGGDSSDWFFLAMAHWQLGHNDEARKWYDQSVAWMEKNQPKNEELIRFRAEAESLLGINTPLPNDTP